MAPRLTVIMIETPPPTASAGQLAEDIVGHLIGRPGIDMTLVRSLSQLQESSTDRLTLDGISADVAVLDWQSPPAIVNALNQLGFGGRRAPHRFDSAPPPTTPDQRRIYAFDLTAIADIGQLIGALDALKSDRQVKTFSIGLGAGNLSTELPAGRPVAPPTRPPSGRPSSPPSGRPDEPLPSDPAPVSKTSADQPRAPRPAGKPSDGVHRVGVQRAPPQVAAEQLDLDDLIDQLDRSDT